MISVVMATYNGEKYIIEQLETIRKQTLVPDEVIFCDDRSTDHTVSMINDYIQQYHLQSSWKVYVNETNLGFGNNFHHAAGLSHGDYIFFADQDDIWDLCKIEIMHNTINSITDCSLLCTDYDIYSVDSNAPQVSKNILSKMPNDNSIEKNTLSKKSVYIGALGCCMCVKRTFYESVEEYWYDGWAHDDRMWKLATCADKCYILHSNLIKHRLHDNNTDSFGKNHQLSKRIFTFCKLRNAALQTLRFAIDNDLSSQKRKVLTKHKKMFDYRIELLREHQLFNILKLVRYLSYYDKKRSYILELLITIKSGIKNENSNSNNS